MVSIVNIKKIIARYKLTKVKIIEFIFKWPWNSLTLKLSLTFKNMWGYSANKYSKLKLFLKKNRFI